MIQLVAVAAVGAVGLYAYNSFRKHMDAINAEEQRQAEAKSARDAKTIGDLEHDPETGRYKVKK